MASPITVLARHLLGGKARDKAATSVVTPVQPVAASPVAASFSVADLPSGTDSKAVEAPGAIQVREAASGTGVFGNRLLRRCRYGWMLFDGPYIGKCFELYGEYSEAEVALMRHFIRPGDTVIDVGANIGDLTLPLAQMVGESGCVYAVESHADTYNVLCANLALNEVRNVRALNVFIAKSNESADTSSADWGEHAYVSELWTPPFVALDSLGLESCRLLKIDVDGKELEVLESGAGLLARCRPVLYFENDLQEASAGLLAFVLGLGYELYWHAPPIFSPQNYLGNPVNHWAPNTVTSAMVLGIPREMGMDVLNLPRIESAHDWWDLGDARILAQTAPGFEVRTGPRPL